MKKFGAFLVFLLAFAVIIAMAGFFAGHWISNSDENLRYVYIGDIDVSGLTRDETEQLLTSRGWKAREENTLTVTTLRGESFTVDPVRSGVVAPMENAVERAYAVGHNGDLVSNLITAVNVFLNPVDVSQTQQNIDTAYLDGLIEDCIQRVQTGLDGEEYTVDAQAGEMIMVKGRDGLSFDKADFRAAVIAALEAGQSELSYTKLASEPAAPDFEAIHTALWKEPSDAYFTDDGTFTVVDEVVGCRFDTQEALRLWNEAKPGETVKIPLEISWPNYTGEFLRGLLYRDLLGACLTKFPNSGDNRRSNLKLCAEKIDEHIVYPGETFSYNEVVGQRTEEAGFLPAPAYVDGDVKDEIGGGACQVSSTLYAATAFAFLETVERSCHVFPVNYMQRGTDATVTIPAEGNVIDFKFRNNRNFPIKIRTYFNNEDSTIGVEIWGTLWPTDYMPVAFDNRDEYGQFDYYRTIDPAYPDRPGYTIKLKVDLYTAPDETGESYVYRTLTYRQVIDAQGNTVEETVLNPLLHPDRQDGYAMDTYHLHP